MVADVEFASAAYLHLTVIGFHIISDLEIAGLCSESSLSPQTDDQAAKILQYP